ncbi:homeodomain-only protein isoform 1-T1 [Macrochelys suwanniensis]
MGGAAAVLAADQSRLWGTGWSSVSRAEPQQHRAGGDTAPGLLWAEARTPFPAGLSPQPLTSALGAEEMASEQPMGPTAEQLEILEYNFSKVNKHPDPTTLCLIAAEAGLSEEETLKWFKQRLAEWRKSEGLPSECGSVRD